MRKTYSIICHDCKQTIWIGQDTANGRKHLYPAATQKLQHFLFGHLRHELEFDDDEHFSATISDWEKYEEVMKED
jgi:hypothetical protein